MKGDKILQIADKLDMWDNEFDSNLLKETATIWNQILMELENVTANDKINFLQSLYEKAEQIHFYGKICLQFSLIFELKDVEYTNRFLEFLLNDNTLSVESAYFLYWQITSSFFPISEGKNEKSSLLLSKYYQKNFYQVTQEKFFNLVEIDKKERDKDFIIIFISQFLSIQHGPTKTALDRAYTLAKKYHKKVLLINTAEMSAKQGMVPLLQYNIGNYNQKFRKYTELEYKDIRISYMQMPDSMLDNRQIRKIVHLVQYKKPYFMLNVGGNSILSDVCSKLAPLLTLSTIPSGLVTTESQFQMTGHVLSAEEKEQLHALGKSEDYVIEGRFTSTVIEQKEHVSREALHIPENRFVMVMVGGRLTHEITEEFMRSLMCFVSDGGFFVFAGGMEQYEEFCEKIPQFSENSVFLGTVKDIFSVLEHCDLYINPPRTGGGTSSVEAMYAGLPVVTYDIGDVPTNTGKEFIVKNEEEMFQTIKRYMEDKEFYQQKSEVAKKRADYMLDTDGAFGEILEVFYQRAGL